MKWIILILFFNVHTGNSLGPFVESTKDGQVIEYSGPKDCAKALIRHGPQKPDDKGNVPLFECIQEGDKSTVKLIDM